MKYLFFILLIGVFFSNPTLANNLKCIEEAKKEAQLFVAADEKLSGLDEVIVVGAFFVEESNNILYYGVGIEYNGYDIGVNVGVFEADCSLANEPNYVTGVDL